MMRVENLVSNTNGEQYKYNALNRLEKYTSSGGTSTTYGYYPDGMRKSKITNGVETKFYYNNKNLINENVNGNKYSYLRGANLIYQSDESNNEFKSYYMQNYHGDVIGVTDSGGNIMKDYDYDIYGNQRKKKYMDRR